MIDRESAIDVQFRLSHELVQSGYLEAMEQMGYRRYTAQAELMDVTAELEEAESKGGKEKKKKKKAAKTPKQIAIDNLCAKLKEKPLFDDRTIWSQVMFARVASWLPNVIDESTGEVHTHYIVSVTVRYPGRSAMSWKVGRRMRHFQAFWNKISCKVSSILAPGTMKNQFPSTMGGWFKANGDKDRNKRMEKLSQFLDELLATSVLTGDIDIYEALGEFFDVKAQVTEKAAQQMQTQQPPRRASHSTLPPSTSAPPAPQVAMIIATLADPSTTTAQVAKMSPPDGAGNAKAGLRDNSPTLCAPEGEKLNH